MCSVVFLNKTAERRGIPIQTPLKKNKMSLDVRAFALGALSADDLSHLRQRIDHEGQLQTREYDRESNIGFLLSVSPGEIIPELKRLPAEKIHSVAIAARFVKKDPRIRQLALLWLLYDLPKICLLVLSKEGRSHDTKQELVLKAINSYNEDYPNIPAFLEKLENKDLDALLVERKLIKSGTKMEKIERLFEVCSNSASPAAGAYAGSAGGGADAKTASAKPKSKPIAKPSSTPSSSSAGELIYPPPFVPSTARKTAPAGWILSGSAGAGSGSGSDAAAAKRKRDHLEKEVKRLRAENAALKAGPGPIASSSSPSEAAPAPAPAAAPTPSAGRSNSTAGQATPGPTSDTLQTRLRDAENRLLYQQMLEKGLLTPGYWALFEDGHFVSECESDVAIAKKISAEDKCGFVVHVGWE